MRIFWNELKKLLNWKLLLILLLFSGLFYWMFLNFDFKYYPNGHPSTECLVLRKMMVAKYGLTIDKAEQKEFETVDYQAIKKAANRELAGMKAFRDARITTVDELAALDDKTDDTSRELMNKLLEASNDVVPHCIPPRPDAFYMYEEARDTVKSFHSMDSGAQFRISGVPTRAAKQRVAELEKRAASEGIPVISWMLNGPLPTWINIMGYFSVLLLFTVAILISPFLVRERRSNVRDLTYTSRKGRRLFSTQFGASLTAAVLAEAVQFAVLFALFLTGTHRGDLLFLKCDVSYDQGTWWDMTFLQYIVWNCVIVFLLAFGYAMVSFAVSKLCRNYVAVLAVQVPLIFLASKLSGLIINNLFKVYHPQFFTPLICSLCVLVPLALCLFLNHREKTTDILT